MVKVEIVALTVASLKAVGSIAVMAAAGLIMTRLGIITNDVRKGLGELSMNLLLPCLMFTQVIYCNTIETHGEPCPNMAQVILGSKMLFVWPLVVVGSGYMVGFIAAKLMKVPENFRRAAAGSVAFGNSTGMPVVLLSTLGPSLVRQGVLGGDPLLYLSVYLVLSPVLQWTVGSYIFRGGPKTDGLKDEEVDDDSSSGSEESYASSNGRGRGSQRRSSELLPPSSPMHEGTQMVRANTIGMPPPMTVGNGFSVQAEVEDVLKVEDVQFPRVRDRCTTSLKKLLFIFISPPVAATLVGILVAFIRPVQNQFVHLNDPDYTSVTVLDWFFKAVQKMGEAAVPVNLIMLGSNLSKGADFNAIPLCTAVVLTVTKMLIQPAFVAFWVFVLSRLSTGPASKGRWLVALVVSLTPTANNIMVQVEMGGQDKAAMSTLIFVQYLMSPVMLTISLTASAALMQIDGFIPSGEGLDFHSIFSFRELR